MSSIKIISWNVNGIRAVQKKGFDDFITKYKPDILCIQETKAHPDQVDLQLPKYNYKFWNSAEKKGYSGTSIFSKIEPISHSYGIDIKKHDNEGRVITLEFEDYYLVNVYTPNAKRDLSRLKYRYNEWDVDFLNFLKNLEKNKDFDDTSQEQIDNATKDYAIEQSLYYGALDRYRASVGKPSENDPRLILKKQIEELEKEADNKNLTVEEFIKILEKEVSVPDRLTENILKNYISFLNEE